MTIRMAPEQIEAARPELLAFLEWRANGLVPQLDGPPKFTPVPDGFAYRNDEAFALKHGRFFEAQPLPKPYRRGEMKRCFANTAELVKRHPDLTYCEGWCVAMIACHHAFAVDPQGRVVDPTWDEPERCLYFGVPFTRDALMKRALRGFRSFFQDWEARHPLLHQGVDVASMVRFDLGTHP
jgi:hypothetical protein